MLANQVNNFIKHIFTTSDSLKNKESKWFLVNFFFYVKIVSSPEFKQILILRLKLPFLQILPHMSLKTISMIK